MTLVMYLRTRVEPVTRRQLEDLFPIYRGTSGPRRFEADKQALVAAGIPLTMTYPEGAHGAAAYRIDADEYYLPLIDLTDAERVAFALATQSVNLRSVTWAQLAGTKLGTVGEPGPTVAHLPVHAVLPDLVDAVTRRRRLTIGYNDSTRDVDPYGLVLARGRWYLVAFCHRRSHVVPFRVDRIAPGSVVVGADDAFVRPRGFDARAAVPDDPKQMGDDPPVEARVRVAPALVPLALDGRDPATAVEPNDPGLDAVHRAGDPDPSWVVVRVPVTHRGAFRSWVLALGDGAEVLGPDEVRADVVDWLQSLAAPGTR
jgi:proteasome accessory factor B